MKSCNTQTHAECTEYRNQTHSNPQKMYNTGVHYKGIVQGYSTSTQYKDTRVQHEDTTQGYSKLTQVKNLLNTPGIQPQCYPSCKLQTKEK